MYNSVEMDNLAFQVTRGILSTEKDQRALGQLDSYERSLVEVHAKGAILDLMKRLISVIDYTKKIQDRINSTDNSNVRTTLDRAFEAWISPAVYSEIGCCNDLILRLCQRIVLVKSEVAEFLFSYIIVDVAGRTGLDVLCKLFSLKDGYQILANFASTPVVPGIEVDVGWACVDLEILVSQSFHGKSFSPTIFSVSRSQFLEAVIIMYIGKKKTRDGRVEVRVSSLSLEDKADFQRDGGTSIVLSDCTILVL